MSLYLVDGHALAYRFYYAFIRRPLVNSKGEETSAVFGFVKSMLNLLEKFNPSHVAVVFDSREETFRRKMFAEYKANRPKMPESLAEQLPRIFSVLEAMSIPSLSVDGYEADDVIATIARSAEKTTPVCIVSGDKDLYQLLSSRTSLIRPGKNGLLDDEIGPQDMRERTGLDPAQFAEYQALMGDPTDNIPGVPGVGKKTALKLISEFGSLKNLYENLDTIPSKALKAKLEEGKEKAFLSLELVRLVDTVPIDVDVQALARKPFDYDRLASLLRELEFKELLDAFGGPPPVQEKVIDTTYSAVVTGDELEALRKTLEASASFAVDVESSSIHPMRAELVGISFATDEGAAWYVPVRSVVDEPATLLTPPRESPGHEPAVVRDSLGPVLADPAIKKFGQNIKYDAIVLANAGFQLRGINFDTMLASYVLHPGRRSHGLDSLVEELLGHRMIPFKSLFDARVKEKDIRFVPLERATEYACEDADYTLRLKNLFDPLLEASQVNELFRDVEMPLSDVLTQMEMQGVALDVDFLKTLSVDLTDRLAKLEETIYQAAGEHFNINSTSRLQDILFRKLGLKPSHKTKTGYSTDVEVLKSLSREHVIIVPLIEYRTLAKLKGTYVDALPRLVNPRTGRVHTSFNQAVTSTGRLSSSDPNLQNIPIRTRLGREIRKAFVARDDDYLLLDADYSQVELRIMAHLSQDVEMVRAFEEGADVHRRTAARIMGVSPEDVTDEMRSRAKTVNFGVMYGMGARGLATQLGIDVKEAKEFIDEYFAKYPGVRRFIDETIAKARREKAVTTLLGRVRQLPDIDGRDGRVRSFSERTAVNTPIQGTAADIIKVAMIRIDTKLRERGLDAMMILQVHDELVFDVPRGELDEVRELVRTEMESAVPLSVCLKVDMGTGQNWLDAHN
ncbi:MAG: DNA polymerase I [bacterium]|nr:DNA polymerase I [bacterium]